jgi:energy-coupling factor transporter ATP-binding protein EcfA2
MVQSPPRTNPFPGLRPFELDEEHLFFGREGQADELLTRLNRTRFLAVVGTSGSGKSSLVRAGLLPSLYSGFLPDASSGWRVAILRPGSAPIANLAAALNGEEVFGVEAASDDAIIRTALTESTLRRGSLGLVEVTRQARMAPREALLVVVDQFEEIFRFKQQAKSLAAEDEAAAFVKLLLAAVEQREVPIFVVLTMRSDFLGDCAQYQDLTEALNAGQYLIPRLTRNQIRIAIEGPVAVFGAQISPRLVNRLLNDMENDKNQLPLLQHALMRTWEHWSEKNLLYDEIDLIHYESIGGIQSALSNHADQICKDPSTKLNLEIVKTLFKCLTQKISEDRCIRRPMTFEYVMEIIQYRILKKRSTELGSHELKTSSSDLELLKLTIKNTIDQFRSSEKAFIMPLLEDFNSLDNKTIIDISHEIIISKWVDLSIWVNEEFRYAKTLNELFDAANRFKGNKDDHLGPKELRRILSWLFLATPSDAWARLYIPDWGGVKKFGSSGLIMPFQMEIPTATKLLA